MKRTPSKRAKAKRGRDGRWIRRESSKTGAAMAAAYTIPTAYTVPTVPPTHIVLDNTVPGGFRCEPVSS